MLSIYKASAGSGKTFTLAYEYIKMLLGEKNPDTGAYSLRKGAQAAHRHILAITFTNKATEEMKARIIDELAALAGMKGDGRSEYMKRLVKEFGCTEDKLRELARKTLHQMLFDFNFFNVSTIDSFFQTILRTFAREAELNGDYELSVKGDEVMEESVQRFFDSLNINSGDPGTRRVIHNISRYLVEQFNRGKAVMLFNRESQMYTSFLKVVQNLSGETFIKSFDRFRGFFDDPAKVEAFEAALIERISALERASREAAQEGLLILEAAEPVAAGRKTVKPFKNTVEGAMRTVMEKGAYGSASNVSVINKVLDNGAAVYYMADYVKMLGEHPLPHCEAAIERFMKACDEQNRHIPLLHEIRTNMFYLSMMVQVHKYMEEYRKDNNALLLSDTNSIVHSIIGDEDTPFIYERLGVRLRHYLIDEFQDTSRMQWQNLMPLLSEGLSRSNDSLVIGDEKQCIYRFRNSDPTLLQVEVARQFADDCLVLGSRPEENTNWRSSADVVNFNNRLFSAIAEGTSFSNIYANVNQQVSEKHLGHGGYVKFTPVEKPSKDEGSEAVLRQLAENIDSQIGAGYRPCDIAVLCRWNSEGCDVVDYLIEHQKVAPVSYNVVSDELMQVSQSPAVRLIVNTLRSIAENDADDYTTKRYKSRHDTLSMISRFELARHRGISPSEALEAALSGEAMAAGAYSARTLTELVEDIVATISSDIVNSQNSFICAFQDILTDYCAMGLNDIRSFLRWWDDKGSSYTISAPDDPNAVRVMTVHKSKGLEFKCVHVPFCNWKVLDFRGVEWFATGSSIAGIDAEAPSMVLLTPTDKMLGTRFADQYTRICDERTLDEFNILYVAFTRAVDDLRVMYQPGTDVGDMIEAGLIKAFGNPQADGSYEFGKPTEAAEAASRKVDIEVATVVLRGYLSNQVPEMCEVSRVDADPEGLG